jgi:hypothetical protein
VTPRPRRTVNLGTPTPPTTEPVPPITDDPEVLAAHDRLRVLGYPGELAPSGSRTSVLELLAAEEAKQREWVETTGRELLEERTQPSSPDAPRLEPVGLQLMVVNFGRPVAALLPDAGVVVLADYRELWPLCDAVADAAEHMAQYIDVPRTLEQHAAAEESDLRGIARPFLASTVAAQEMDPRGLEAARAERQRAGDALVAALLKIAALKVLRPGAKHATLSRPAPLPDVVLFHADRIHAGIVEALGRVDEWRPGHGFWRALSVTESFAYSQVVGFYRDPGPELWDFLHASGDAAIKAHYALWARCYEETDADPHRWVTLDVSQFCSDLGYAKQKAGGYKTRDKQHAMRVLDALTTAELAVAVRPGKRLRGPIWARGLAAEQRDEYGDLFGSARAGERELWEPVGFTYRPGQWFEDEDWRKRNAFVGMVGIGLLRLDSRDKWPLRIGGYYGTLARVSGYADRTIRAATVLARTGLAKLGADHPARQLEAFERAHDRLREVGVLKAWEWATERVTEEPDMDDPAALAELADYGAGDWRRQSVRLTWPDRLAPEAERLRTAKQRKITAAARRRRPARAKGSTG